MAVPYHVMARDTTIAKLDNRLFELLRTGLVLFHRTIVMFRFI